MSNVFTEDQMFWDERITPVQHSYSTWTFSSEKFYIGSNNYALDRTDDHRTSFVLGFFDVNFTYWKSRSHNTDDNHVYLYYTRLRSAVEAHFDKQTSTPFGCPPILQPWLWRTFALCPETPDGRAKSRDVLLKYGVSLDSSQEPLPMTYWNQSLQVTKPHGFRSYLPERLHIAKTILGVPEKKNQLHCWQFYCFSSHFPTSGDDAGNKQENESEAWKSLLADPTFTRTSTNRDFINIEQLQRLKPGSELNCDIINLYHWQCRSQQPNENKKTVVATYFWPQIILGKSGYNSATKFLFKALFDGNAKLPKEEGIMLQRLRDALADIETLLIPILFNNNHWLLFVMDFNAKGWVFFDSMASLAKNAGRAAIAKSIIDYFQSEINFDCGTWAEIKNRTAPQQVIDIPATAGINAMLGWRHMMVLELASGKIRWKMH